MKVLLAEYAMFHDPFLASEGKAMLGVLTNSFTRCGYDVVIPDREDLAVEISRLAPQSDIGLVIAPDHLLARYTSILERHTRNLGCGAMSAAICAHKQKTGMILASHGIPVPEEMPKGLRVVKPVQGCGSKGVRLTRTLPRKGEFAQKYIEGDHLSVSVLAGRVVGEACLYYSGKPPIPLAINKQEIKIEDGVFRYLGGETPLYPPREKEIIQTAIQVVQVLGCQGYIGVDVVVSDRVYVVDVNPRITTSLIGIAAIMEEEIADLLVRASQGDIPPQVHHHCGVRFTKEGKVSRQ
ncbi:MAG: ATP-grasp domain-containing protein [Methanomicrobiales archaeon]|nr:ATP-grasp domain-containing protein [Methanomicrobiales archaeon]